MKPTNSRVTKTIALTLASLFTTLTSMALSMLMARMLSLSDLAVYKQTLLAYQTFVPILGLGIAQGMYFALSRNEGRIRAVTKESMLILGGMGLLYTLFIVCGGRAFLAQRVNNPLVADMLLWMAPLALIATPSTICGTIFVYQDRIPLNAKFSAFTSLFCILCVLAAVLLFQNAQSAVISYATSHIAVSLLGLFIAYRLLPKDDGKLRPSSMRAILTMSVPLGVASMLGTLSNSLDKWIISFMRTPEEYAVFSYGAYELPFLSTIAGAISTVIIVDMVKYTKEHRYDDALALFRKVAEITSYVIFPVMMLFMVVAEPFYEFMYTKTMLPAVPVFRVYLLMLPIRTVMYGPLLIAMGKSKQVLYRTIAGLVANLVLSILLVMQIGTIGATVATVLTLYTVAVPINLLIIGKECKKRWRELLPWKHFGKCFAYALPATGVAFFAMYALREAGVIYQLITSCLSFAIICSCCYVWMFHIDYRRIVRSVITRLGMKR